MLVEYFFFSLKYFVVVVQYKLQNAYGNVEQKCPVDINSVSIDFYFKVSSLASNIFSNILPIQLFMDTGSEWLSNG